MVIYPAIDIKDGKCVRLQQGKFDQVTVFSNQPWEIAVKWQEAGASFIHVVDLDGARYGSSYNQEIIHCITKCVSIPIQVGGGIRNMRDIEDKLDLGVNRVILGTAAIKDPEFVKEAVHTFKEKIVLGVDAANGFVAVEGWEEVSKISAVNLCLEMKEVGIKTIIYTDIAKDGMMSGPNVDATGELVRLTGLDIIASGGISSLPDLESVAKAGVHGAIIGKALYQETISLRDAVEKFER